MYEIFFLKALLTTVLVETLFLYLLVRFVLSISSKKLPTSDVLLAGVAASSFTLPLLWFLLPHLLSDYLTYFMVGETLVIVIETVIYYLSFRVSIPRAFFLSFFCNEASIVFGLLLQSVIFT